MSPFPSKRSSSELLQVNKYEKQHRKKPEDFRRTESKKTYNGEETQGPYQ